MMGIGNTLLDNLLDVIDKTEGLEDTPPVLREKRKVFLCTKRENNELKELFSMWSDFGGTRLAIVRLGKSALIAEMKMELKHWNQQQRLFANADKDEMSDEIAELVMEKRKIEKSMKEKSAELTSARRELEAEEQRFGKRDRALLQLIEEHFLERFQVSRGAYHGGDLTGGSVKKLMQNARDICSELEVFLAGVVDDKKGMVSEDDWGILVQKLEKTMLCLESFDGLFSRLRTTPADQEMADKMVTEASDFLKAGLSYWRILGLSITPKVHLLEDHVLLRMVIENGLWNKDEEFIKRAHQKGLKYNKVTRNSMRDAARRYTYMSRWDRACSMAKVQQLQRQTNSKRKRTIEPKLESKAKRMKTERDFNRAIALDEYTKLDMEDIID